VDFSPGKGDLPSNGAGDLASLGNSDLPMIGWSMLHKRRDVRGGSAKTSGSSQEAWRTSPPVD